LGGFGFKVRGCFADLKRHGMFLFD
jgi:hypothetical protein